MEYANASPEPLSSAERASLSFLDQQMAVHPEFAESLSKKLRAEVKRFTQGVAP